MSITFTFKELSHHKVQTLTYLKSSISLIALNVTFYCIVGCLGLMKRPAEITLYNDSILSIFSKFNSFIIILLLFFTIFTVIVANHGIIQQRKRDMAIMKAIGTLPTNVMSYYLTEIMILVFVSSTFGLILGYGGFILLYIILEMSIPTLIWDPNIPLVIIFFILLNVLTFVYNGWEIRKLSNKSFGETASGKIDENVNRLVKSSLNNLLRKRSIAINIGIKNLIRKLHENRQKIILLTLSGVIITTSFIGVLILGTTSKDYIQSSQSNYDIIIGHKTVIGEVHTSYERFSNENLPSIDVYAENENSTLFTDSSYNISTFQSDFFTFLDPIYSSISLNNLSTLSPEDVSPFFQKQMFSIMNASENIKYTVDYEEIGQGDRGRLICVLGLDDMSVIEEYATVDTDYSDEKIGVIGDTLAADLFEEPLTQSFDLNDGENEILNLFAYSTVIDSFNNGNNAYFPLSKLQTYMDLPNYSNFFVINSKTLLDGTSLSYEKFLEDLDTWISETMGSDYGYLDLNPIFKQNEDAFIPIMVSTILLSVIIAIFVIYTMINNQKARIEEDPKDLIMFKTIGLDKKDFNKSLFIENGLLLSLSVFIAFIISMGILMFLLVKTAILPPLSFALAFIGIYLALLLTINWWVIRRITSKYYKFDNLYRLAAF